MRESSDQSTRAGTIPPGNRFAPRSRRYSWMLNGWTIATSLNSGAAGTEFVTIGVPDDFHAVRVGFANITPEPWVVTKVVACASASWNDYITPLGNDSEPRTAGAWTTLTFRGGGADAASLVTAEDALAEIIVAGNAPDPASGETTNPAWTFTDWVPCASIGADPATGMRVLMLRALVPGEQTVTYTNGRMDEFHTDSAINQGRRYLVGGLKFGHDLVNDPTRELGPAVTIETLRHNHIVNGQMMCLIQVMTRNASIVGMVCGDSHQAGTGSTAHVNNFLVQCLLGIDRITIGKVATGVVNTAMGGATSAQFFPRMAALLHAARPTFVVIPGWSFNDRAVGDYADTQADGIVFTRMLFAADQVRQAGAVPIFLTPFPRDPPSMSPEVVRRWLTQRDALLALREAGEYVVDATAILSARKNGAFLGTYLPGLSLDRVHPNDAGHAALARALSPIVLEIAGLSGERRAPPPHFTPTDATPAPATNASAARPAGVSRLLPWKRRGS